MIKTTSCSKR